MNGRTFSPKSSQARKKPLSGCYNFACCKGVSITEDRVLYLSEAGAVCSQRAKRAALYHNPIESSNEGSNLVAPFPSARDEKHCRSMRVFLTAHIRVAEI